jgi:CheY-like chemotaxis protein/signal transduction histidine kinase
MTRLVSRWRPAPGLGGRAIALVAVATLPWLVWLAWPAPDPAPGNRAGMPIADASVRLAELSSSIDGWQADAAAIAADPALVGAMAVGDDRGLAELLANHERVTGYGNALVVDPDLRVRAFARPTRWAGLRVPRSDDPLARVLEASRIAEGPALSPLAGSGGSASLYVAAPIRDRDRALGTLVLVAGPSQFAALRGAAAGPDGTTQDLVVPIDGTWHRLDVGPRGEARLARRPSDAGFDRLLLQATTGAEATGVIAAPDGAPVALVARSFGPLNAVLVVARPVATPDRAAAAGPSALWPLSAAVILALALAVILSQRQSPPPAASRRAARREPRLSRDVTGESGGPAPGPAARSALLGALGPELRAPLAAVLGTAELAATEATEPRLAARIGRIRASAETLLGYLDDLALLAGLEAGHAPARREPFRLRDVVADLARRCAPELATAGRELLVRRAAGVPDALVGDRERLADALVRIVRAAHARIPGGRPVRLVVEAPDDAADGDADDGTGSGRRLVISVHGLDGLLALDDCFDTATLIDDRAAPTPSATSIGIRIAARLVESLGADALWSADGDAPAFRFELPLASDVAAEPARPSLRGRRALIVDELGVCAELLAEQLARAGLDVHETATVAAAASELRRAIPPRARPYDLLLVDDRVADLDRLPALVAGRAEGRPLPPVVLIATPGTPSGGTRSADARLDRPVDEPVVLETVAGVLGLGPGPSATEAVPQARSDRPLAGRRLLLVDDNATNREVGVELLQRAGAAVETAADGRAAVDALAAGRTYDAVLMDLEMPRMDGLSASRAIRALPGRSELPIIAWSAHVLPQDRARCLDAGMNDHLPKPVLPERLYATVARWTGGIATPAPEAESGGARRGEAPDAPPLDADSAIRYLGDDASLYRRLLAAFADEHADDAVRIGVAIATGRRGEAREAAHALKGLAATLGMGPLSRVSATIELNLRAGSAVPDSVLDALRDRLAEALHAATRWLAEYAPTARSDDQGVVATAVDREAELAMLDAQIERGELAALGTFERLSATRRADLDDAEWEAVHEALVRLDFERAASLRRRIG